MGLVCSAACGIFLNQGLNLCPLHWRVVHLLQPMNLHWHIIIIQSPQFTLGFTLGVVHSMGLDKHIMNDMYPSLRYHNFTALKFLSALPIHLPFPLPSNPGNHWSSELNLLNWSSYCSIFSLISSISLSYFLGDFFNYVFKPSCWTCFPNFNFQELFLSFLLIFIYLLLCFLAAPGFSCGLRDLHYSMWTS